MATHYEVLGVGRLASPDEVQQAYRRLARRHHPDVSPDTDPARMAAINGAWEVLGDPDRRRAYDVALGIAQASSRAAARPDPGWRPLDDDDDDADRDADWDLLDDQPVRPAPPRRPSDLLVMVPVMLVLLAVALFFFSTMSGSTSLRSLSMLLVPVSGVGFVAAPLFVMVRSRSKD